ncbi:MAG: hypothetical protein JXP73_04600 [Deltaproteobacteria bacterium]|nr:hypothetical protein [Deltaproteobacteria bacterium]
MRNAFSRSAILAVCLSAWAACGDDTSPADGGTAAGEAGICGTHANPAVLELANLTPALGATVANHAIVHSFTVVRAPAQFNNFELRFGASHSAGLPTPEKPRFEMTVTGSDLLYQLTIHSWARSPGHVELVASGGYDTAAGCTWSFPSPLFSYDIVGAIDAGAALEAGSARPLDAATDVALDSAAASDGGAPIDAPPVDAGIDRPAPVDAGTNPDAPLAQIDADGVG